jgi:hypothetical protein
MVRAAGKFLPFGLSDAPANIASRTARTEVTVERRQGVAVVTGHWRSEFVGLAVTIEIRPRFPILAHEASATRSSQERRSGFCDRSVAVSACHVSQEFSCATHEDDTTPKTRPQCKAILTTASFVTDVFSNILL